ncbi:MAG: mechanosensitive ion channel family protein [Phycisphaeraceae bacterium]|nr:MAG: mechanosensitive ion channel family protein [Phycisphaeraceae bacterium]
MPGTSVLIDGPLRPEVCEQGSGKSSEIVGRWRGERPAPFRRGRCTIGTMRLHVKIIRLLLALALMLIAPTPLAVAQNGPDVAETTPNAAQSPEPEPEPEPEPAPERDSPRSTMFTFLEAMHRFNEAPMYSRARSAAMTDAVACLSDPGGVGGADFSDAVMLLGVLNRIGEVQPHTLPNRRDVARRGIDSFTYFPQELRSHKPLRVAAPDGVIEFERGDDGEWRFSPETVEGVSSFYRAADHLPIAFGVHERKLSLSIRLRQLVPPALRRDAAFGVEYWQWIGLLFLILLSVTLDFTIRAVLSGVAARKIRRRNEEPNPASIKRTVRPFGLFASALLFLGTIQLLGLPDGALLVVLPAIRLFLMLAGVWAGFRVTDLVAEVFAKKASRTKTKFDDLLVPLLRRAVKIFIFIFGLIYIANSLQIEILPLLTGLGIGGLAFAFAARDTIENFFGSVAVLIDRPFEVGDWVKINDVEGIIETLGFRSTRVRTFQNSLVTMPNAILVRATVDNFGRRQYRRTWQDLGIAYDTPPDRVEAFCEGIRELIRNHPHTRKDFYIVNFTEFKDDHLNIVVCVFFIVPDWVAEMNERQRLFLDIMRLADQLGVEFAFPTQTLYMRREQWPPGEHDPAKLPGPDGQSVALDKGRQAAADVIAEAPWRGETPDARPRPKRPMKSGGKDPTKAGESDT